MGQWLSVVRGACSPGRATALFERIAAALRPGAPLCVLDLYSQPEDKRPDSGSVLGLFFHLTSGADLYRVEQVSGWLRAAGFTIEAELVIGPDEDVPGAVIFARSHA